MELFLDLYYKYYLLLKHRAKINKKIDVINPYEVKFNCPENVVQITELIEIGNEEKQILNKPETKESLTSKIFEYSNALNKRNRIHDIIDGCNSDDTERQKLDAELRYIDYELKALCKKIQALRENGSVLDPFEYLETKFELNSEEIELVLFLFFTNFHGAGAVRGISLLRIITTNQWQIYSMQDILFNESPLIKNDLIQKTKQGYDALSSFFAISDYSNLIISDLHPEFRHLRVKFEKKENSK